MKLLFLDDVNFVVTVLARVLLRMDSTLPTQAAGSLTRGLI
jgi:hypothetical protein